MLAAAFRLRRTGEGMGEYPTLRKQEAAPYPNLEAGKEKGTVVAVPFEVLLTQGFTHRVCPTLS